MPFDADDIRAAEELNRLWDARNLGNLIDDESPDLAMFDRLAACDDAPVPDGAFAAKLRSTLMAMPEPVSTPSHHAIGIVKPLNAPWPFVSGRRIATPLASSTIFSRSRCFAIATGVRAIGRRQKTR